MKENFSPKIGTIYQSSASRQNLMRTSYACVISFLRHVNHFTFKYECHGMFLRKYLVVFRTSATVRSEAYNFGPSCSNAA